MLGVADVARQAFHISTSKLADSDASAREKGGTFHVVAGKQERLTRVLECQDLPVLPRKKLRFVAEKH
ncbi:hypothetical protein ACFX2J_036740 [Malus domestica]